MSPARSLLPLIDMKISVREQSLVQDLVFSIFVLSMAGAAGFFWVGLHSPRIAIALAVSAAIVFVAALIAGRTAPLLVIDDNGVFDRRLGIGRISWADIESVQIAGGYGHRMLALRLHEPERFVRRLRGHRRMRVNESHELGFRQFNIDLRDVDLNLLDLKKLIERRIS